ncbi:surfeit locus protein 6 [Amphiprion ocellaris]|uniref:Ribosomal RNA-processing protein 14/surfeit locus protein 6 C-terminal domain-containing protein n=1 Tax=Amphiprion ocellaris TaxID=80972 RepID=A0A3Q1BB55_AMPOC|nr:surfeit locus protein 6 [Amphiprion ocellaris]
MDLASKDSYIQKFASKVFSQRDQEPKKRPFVHFKGKSDSGEPKKKKKCKKKHFKDKGTDEKTPKPQKKAQPSPAAQKSLATGKPHGPKTESINGARTQKPQGGNVDSSFSTVDVLRKRLHEKIEESRGQGPPKDALSEAVQAKRVKRKLERERKKRKRKEFLMKKLAEKNGQEQVPEIKQEQQPAPASSKRNETAIVFNKVETVEEGYVDKIQKKKNKKQSVKGQVTPLMGKNYKQLLSRVEARKAKVEQLREKDEEKARELEKKIQWTNLLYKAEGIKIKDDEDMLRASLKKKEKRHDQRKKRWNKRSENIIEKMQQRQDKRRKNLQKRKQVKTEKKKDRARKKGRVLPEDLKKAAV